MTEENPLFIELFRLDTTALKRLNKIWNIQKPGRDKKSQIQQLMSTMSDEFFVRGILEKLSPVQVSIYTSILATKDRVMTLGEISRKFGLQPASAEMEMGVLKRYFLVYQRKNRERLTNTLDRYYAYQESSNHVKIESNDKGQKFRQSISKVLKSRLELPSEWQKASQAFSTKAHLHEQITALIEDLTDLEQELLLRAYGQGGILEIAAAREFIEEERGKWMEIVRKMDRLGLLLDDYYVDERFVRMMIMPVEVFESLTEKPLILKPKKGIKRSQERTICNDLDFFINIKKQIVYITRKGLNLAKSGKIKQTDLRETENRLLRPDTALFLEKSQIYQIELLLPVLRMLDIVRTKRDDVVLRNDFDTILQSDPLKLMKRVMTEVKKSRERVTRYEEVFESVYVPFYLPEVLDETVKLITNMGRCLYTTVMAIMIRENIILAKQFQIQSFPDQLNEYRKELTSSLFFLQLFGLITTHYPDRWIELSNLGQFYFQHTPLVEKDEKGGVIINPDLSLIAIPEKLSQRGLFLLKAFCEVKSFENVYNFQLSRESFQEGVLLKAKKEEFIEFLKQTSRNELPQNLLYSLDEWTENFPLVTITDECVVLQTEDPNHMDLLLGQIGGKKVVLQQISPTTILIDPDKIYEVVEQVERLQLIVKLVR
ncbi:MAG: helicase-associated domain-containing protein [Leptonema sp. (in: Bacteria)]|nr:helicase-associated domain-containing protein [Leptonema sp. (in: bacteria)]